MITAAAVEIYDLLGTGIAKAARLRAGECVVRTVVAPPLHTPHRGICGHVDIILIVNESITGGLQACQMVAVVPPHIYAVAQIFKIVQTEAVGDSP